jgi:hypothetical protein
MKEVIMAKIWATFWEIIGIFFLCSFILTLIYNVEMFYKILTLLIGLFCMAMKLYNEA